MLYVFLKCISYTLCCCDQIPGRNNLREEIYLEPLFQRVQSMHCLAPCPRAQQHGVAACVEELLHFILDRMGRETARG
jgi:hypothetical protein